MRRIFLSLVLLPIAACATDSAEHRLRQYFAVPANVSSNTTALSAAILEQLKVGTPESDIAATLRARGVGADSLSGYYPPTHSDTAIIRVERDRPPKNVVLKSYVVRLIFDSTRRLSDVKVTEGLTGP
jgi:hypothetical protein